MFRDENQRHRLGHLVEKWIRISAGEDKKFLRQLHIWLWANDPAIQPPAIDVEHLLPGTARLTQELIAAVGAGASDVESWIERYGPELYG